MRSDESRVSKSRASSPDGRGVTPPISEPFPINPQTSASPNAGQPLAMQKRVRQTIITQQHSVQLAFFRNAALPAELCRLINPSPSDASWMRVASGRPSARFHSSGARPFALRFFVTRLGGCFRDRGFRDIGDLGSERLASQPACTSGVGTCSITTGSRVASACACACASRACCTRSAILFSFARRLALTSSKVICETDQQAMATLHVLRQFLKKLVEHF